MHFDVDLVISVAGSNAYIRSVGRELRVDFAGLWPAIRFWRAARKASNRNELVDTFKVLMMRSHQTCQLYIRDRVILHFKTRKSPSSAVTTRVHWCNLLLAVWPLQ